MRKLVAMFTVISLLIVFGCGNDSTGPSENGDYMPLAAGNQLNFTLSGYFVPTSADTTVISGSQSVKVLEVTTHQQGFQLYAIQDITTMIMTTPDTSITTVETDTIYAHKTDTELRMYDDTTSTDYELLLKLPVTLAESWIPESDEPTTTRTVLSLSASVTVPAGTFATCANLRDTDSTEPDFYFHMFFSKGTGLVKYVNYETDSDGAIYLVSELTSSIIN
ncbi:MAG: hypothetical protein GQ565_05980 [Candidatus Aegiribacteria sp.]|nr:hypothetical protein [Candidatus Aegiribacteria sp.]